MAKRWWKPPGKPGFYVDDAWDIVSPEAKTAWRQLAETCKYLGLESGMTWGVTEAKPFGKDRPHINPFGWQYHRPDNWREKVRVSLEMINGK